PTRWSKVITPTAGVALTGIMRVPCMTSCFFFQAEDGIRDEAASFVVYSHEDDLDWDLRLQLPGVEGQLLSARSPGGEDAALLRRALSDGRDQLHVLPDAERDARRRMGGADAGALQAHAEGAAPDHARQPAEERRRARRHVLPGGRHARRQARRASLPAAAEPEEGRRAVRRVPRRAAAEGVRRVRVPPRVVAGR